MELSVAERLTLLSLLPREGSFRNMKVVRQLREALAFDKDAESFKLRETPLPNGTTTYSWDRGVPQTAEMEIGERAVEVIADSLKRLDQQGKLPESAVSLWEKFVEANHAGKSDPR